MIGHSDNKESFSRRVTPRQPDTGAEGMKMTEADQGQPRQARQLPAARLTDDGELHLELPSTLTADQVVFLAEIRSLAKRVAKNRFWARQEIFLLLENAANAGVILGDLEKGESVYKRAAAVYERALLARNRFSYIVGTALGVVVLLIVLLVGTAALAQYGITSLAPAETIISLFAFAAMGSVTSVLIRLSTLDLKEETSRTLLMLSGASKPLVAIAFASIVYIVLKYKLIAITIGSPDGIDEAADQAAYWIAAFLCGFSERFGSDIIARLGPKTAD